MIEGVASFIEIQVQCPSFYPEHRCGGNEMKIVMRVSSVECTWNIALCTSRSRG